MHEKDVAFSFEKFQFRNLPNVIALPGSPVAKKSPVQMHFRRSSDKKTLKLVKFFCLDETNARV